MSNEIELKFNADIPKLMVGLSWDPNEYQSVLKEDIVAHNLDLSCAVLNKNLQVKDIIMPDEPKRSLYKNQIYHMGDHLSGGSDFEDEEIHVNFANLDADIFGLAFVVSANNKVKFSDVANGNCSFLDAANLDPFLSVELQGIEKPHYLVGITMKNDHGDWILQNTQKELLALDAGLLEEALRSAA